MSSTSAADPSSIMKESPNWLEMPEELMVNIFQRLPSVEILKSTRKVCTIWGKISKYPAMWKVINMLKRPVDGRDWHRGLDALTKEAVDLSCGELIDVSIERFGTDELLDYIVLHSNKVRRLCLVSCGNITDSALSLAVKRLPQLEELHLLVTHINAQDLQVIGRNCPQLKSFKMSKEFSMTYDDNALAIADSMPELRHLDLSDFEMTNNGLEAILNGCPHLESLYLRGCPSVDLDGYLGKLCMERIKDFKHDPTQDCGFFDLEDFIKEDLLDICDSLKEIDFYEN